MNEAFIVEQLNNAINLLRSKLDDYRQQIKDLTSARKYIVIECYDNSHTQLPLHKTSAVPSYGVALFSSVDEATKFVGNLIDHEGIDWSFKDSPYDSWKAIGRSDKGRKFVVVECIN